MCLYCSLRVQYHIRRYGFCIRIFTSTLLSVQTRPYNDPSAGSPTETLLRLLLPLNGQVWRSSRTTSNIAARLGSIQRPHQIIQSVVATGGVYKGQGRNQHKLMTCAYSEFLVHGEQLQAPIPDMTVFSKISRTFQHRMVLIDTVSVARVRPRTSKGITDLLLLNFMLLNATYPSKKSINTDKHVSTI